MAEGPAREGTTVSTVGRRPPGWSSRALGENLAKVEHELDHLRVITNQGVGHNSGLGLGSKLVQHTSDCFEGGASRSSLELRHSVDLGLPLLLLRVERSLGGLIGSGLRFDIEVNHALRFVFGHARIGEDRSGFGHEVIGRGEVVGEGELILCARRCVRARDRVGAFISRERIATIRRRRAFRGSRGVCALRKKARRDIAS